MPFTRSYHLDLLAASFASLLIEIAYTRVISYKLYYYYVYFVIGLALLGIGSGGVAVALSKRLRALSTDTVLFFSLLLGAVATFAGYLIVASVRINSLSVWLYNGRSFLDLGLLLVLCLCVFIAFIPMGVIAATLFGRFSEGVGGLYFADLVGASAACLVVIYAISHLGAPATVMLAVTVFLAAAALAGYRRGWAHVAVASGLALLSLVFLVDPSLLPSQRLDSSKTAVPPGQTVASDWGSVFRVDISRPPGYPDLLNLYHDGILGAGIYRWNGQPSFLNRYNFPSDPRSLPFRTTISPPQNEAIIGAAGGHEVLASLYYGAQHVDAVELNPVTVHWVSNTFASFDGHLAQNPHVSYINADGRSFIARSGKSYNLIWYPAPDSYAATNAALSSAYVLSESYLYTTNGIQTMLQHLTSNGQLVVQFGEDDTTYDLRTARIVGTARQALANLGIHDPASHILVATTQSNFLGGIPLSTMLVQRSPFTPAEVAGFAGGVKAVPATTILSAEGKAPKTNPVNEVVDTPSSKLNSFYSHYAYDITPTTDNNPFFYHFARWGTVISNFFHPLSSSDRENAVGERVLLLLFLLSLVLAAVLLLLPFVARRDVWRQLDRKGLSAVFFGGLGLGFIFFEIVLMQDLNLFLGFPTYSLTITLTSLLASTGIGALLSRRVHNTRRAIVLLLALILALGVFYIAGLTPLTTALLGIPLGARILISVLLVAPLGVCLGMFMPIGLRGIAERGNFPRQYIAWAWAINGFASVVGSALATMLAMSLGFNLVMGLGLACYVIAVGAWLAPRRLSAG